MNQINNIDSIYFDLDETLITEGKNNGKSIILEKGLKDFKELEKKYPKAKKRLLTNRRVKEISYPRLYKFSEVVGKEDMVQYINDNLGSVKFRNLLSPKRLYFYLFGLYLYCHNETPKLLYIFLRSIKLNEKIIVLDDDKRVSLFFGKKQSK